MFKRYSAAIGRFVYWLGPVRTRLFFFLLAGTGLSSLILNALAASPDMKGATWITPVQSFFAVAFLVGGVWIVISRFTGPERLQVILLVGPPVFAVALGFFFPPLFILALVLAGGWLVIAPITARSRIRGEYQTAIRAMRRGEFQAAIKTMTDLIEAESGNADHFRFRAELYRLAGNLKKARGDYDQVIRLSPESGVGYNGLAEVYLQMGEYDQALDYARRALKLEPRHWVATYNLGMIEERLKLWSDSAAHLIQSLAAGIPDSRHRLLALLWLARAYHAQHDESETMQALEQMTREQAGLREWHTIFGSEQAVALRAVLQEDVARAEHLITSLETGTADLSALEADYTTARTARDND